MKERRRLLNKLKKLVSLGHLPHREYQKYDYITQSKQHTSACANCFAHACFNLSNEEIEEVGITEKEGEVFGQFMAEFLTPDEGIERQLMDFVKKTGLEIEPILKEEPLKSNQWKVAMYINHMGWFGKDFHFFLQEKNGLWTNKQGSCENINVSKSLPKYHHSYEFYKTYVITNPFAREK